MPSPWNLGPFVKMEGHGTVLGPNSDSEWTCPIAGFLRWEEKDVFNPAAVVHRDRIHLLYRAEDAKGKHLGTSRIGLASSLDGETFSRRESPVLFPDRDDFQALEWEGGCEDPRVCESHDGTLFMTYTAYDGVKARLCIASSLDLVTWHKHGLAFPNMPELWSKAGSIVCQVEGERLVATKLNGKYWMYFGESYIFAATSDDLISWHPVTHPMAESSVGTPLMPSSPDIGPKWNSQEVGESTWEKEVLVSVLRPRSGRFDSMLVEPGPPAVLTEAGIVLMYHGKNSVARGDPRFPPNTYCVGQALLDPRDPTSVLARESEPFLQPETDVEKSGQVSNVCFATGLVPFGDRWFLYYGTADSQIALAIAHKKPSLSP